MTEIKLLKPARKAEKLRVVILPTIHNERPRLAKKAVRLQADNNHAMPIVCPEVGKVRIAEANSPTIRKALPNQGKKVVRQRVAGNQAMLTNPLAVVREAVAAATLPMTGIKPLKLGVREGKTAVAEAVNPDAL